MKKLMYKKTARFCVNLYTYMALVGLVVVFPVAFASGATTPGQMLSEMMTIPYLIDLVFSVGAILFALNAFNDESYYPYKWNIAGRWLKHIAMLNN